MPKRIREHHTWLLGQLDDPIVAASYLNAARKDTEELFLVALRNVAEANKMARVAKTAKLSRETLYRTLSKQGNPSLKTLGAVLDAMGLSLAIEPKHAIGAPQFPAVMTRIAPTGIPITYSESALVGGTTMWNISSESTDADLKKHQADQNISNLALNLMSGSTPNGREACYA